MVHPCTLDFAHEHGRRQVVRGHRGNSAGIVGFAEVTPFQAHWQSLANRFGLTVKIPFFVVVDNQTATVPVLLEDFGAERGMLLVTDFDTIADVQEQILAQGFGYSTLNKSFQGDDHDALGDMLRDWGWTGQEPPLEPVRALLKTPEIDS